MIKSKSLFRQIKYSLFFKILAIVTSFLAIRFTLNLLGIDAFGVWVIILTFINFIIFFDLGITNGIKNKLTVSLTTNNIIEARSYITTGYGILTIISSILFILFYFIFDYINWNNVFNVQTISNAELNKTMKIIIFFIMINFVLSLINGIVNAFNKSSLLVLNQLMFQLLAFLMVLFLISIEYRDLTFLAIAYGVSLISSSLFITIYFFKNKMMLLPKYEYFDFNKIRDIISLGIKFFILQLTIFLMLSTDKILIAQLIGVSHVASYDILYKYFSILIIIHTTINIPLWPRYTEAYENNDYRWIVATLKKMLIMTIFLFFIGVFMIIFADVIIKLWIGNGLNLDIGNYIYMYFLTSVLIWYAVFGYFTNGIDKPKIQLQTSIIGTIINIPLSILFVEVFGMGMNGVILATIVSLSLFSIFGPIQTYKELKKMKKIGGTI